jgi:flagellar hook assembly protein FlgD
VVKTLVDEPVKAGYHSLIWDGRNETGRAVASGIYFVQLQAGSYQQTRKLALIK